MEPIAQYPIESSMIEPHIGRPVYGLLNSGDPFYGVVDRIHDGHLVLRPWGGAGGAADVQSMKKKLKGHPNVQAAMQRAGLNKANTRAFGLGGLGGFGGYPYGGFGYGNFGWGAGWWWILPLFFITALFAFPFFW